MPDRPSPPIEPEPDPLESRLDALGRLLVEEESRRIHPPRAYLDAAAERVVVRRLRLWAPRLALAATLLLAGVAAFILTRPASSPGRAGPGPIAAASDPTPMPTVANLHAANREVTSPDQLQLLTGAGAAGESADAASPYRASDTRRPERIDAILGEK